MPNCQIWFSALFLCFFQVCMWPPSCATLFYTSLQCSSAVRSPPARHAPAIGSRLLSVIRRRMAQEDEHWATRRGIQDQAPKSEVQLIRKELASSESEHWASSPPLRSLIIITAHQHTEKRTSCLEGVAGNLLHSSKAPLPPPAQANHPSFSGRFLCLCLSYLSNWETWCPLDIWPVLFETSLQSSVSHAMDIVLIYLLKPLQCSTIFLTIILSSHKTHYEGRPWWVAVIIWHNHWLTEW